MAMDMDIFANSDEASLSTVIPVYISPLVKTTKEIIENLIA